MDRGKHGLGERRVVELKREYRILLLRTMADYARARGDSSVADEIDSVIDRILRPRPLKATLLSPSRGKQLTEIAPAEEGGRP